MSQEAALAALEPVLVTAVRSQAARQRSSADYEDALQEARLAVWQALETRDDVDERLAYTIAKRRAYDLYVDRLSAGDTRNANGKRRRRFEPRAESLDEMLEAQESETTPVSTRALGVLARATRTEDETAQVDDRLALEPALAALSPVERRLVELVYYEGYGVKPAAALVGCAVRRHAEALAKMRAELVTRSAVR
jgi:RNA polymerase sigma factor (sigma-70 family)